MAYGSGTYVRTHNALGTLRGTRYDTYAANWTYRRD
jgi:hypothetical protein